MAMAQSSTPLGSVLVTGGCGFIKTHIIKHILDLEPACHIHVIDINTKCNRLPSVVYHTELFEKVNVGGTRNLLASANKLGTVQALVNCGTSSVIHDNLSDLVEADETLPILQLPAQKRAYTLTKATAEREILASNRKSGDHSMLTVSLRSATAFGENDHTCLGKMYAVARKGQIRFQMCNGKNLYDFMYVGNLANAHILAAQALLRAYGKPPRSADQRVDGEAFNIANDEHILFWEFTRKILAAVGHPVKKEDIVVIPKFVGLFIGWASEWVVWVLSRGKEQPNMTMEGTRFSTITRILSVEKAKRVLGYRPRINMDEGIIRGVSWFMENEKTTQ